MRWQMRILLLVAALAAPPSASADTIDVNGTMRSFTVQSPTKKPAPLVVVLHGKTQRGADMIARTAWPQVAKREGFAVVFPDGLNHAWADARTKAGPELRGPPPGTDDVAFIAKLVDKLVADGTADAKRVYVTGVSNGGAMVMTLVCARADLFVAGASVIMNLTDESAVTCHPSRPLPMLLMNGTADPLIPYEGGRGSSYFAADGFWSTETTVAFWRELNGCETDDADVTDMPDKAPADQSTVTRISSRCPTGHDVVLYRINGGGHRMPGFAPDARFPKVATGLLGPQNGDIDGAETIWAFFSRFR
ncbi:prolyl oligopeptidase family serine peptidase [Bradyrhizobium sp. WYCCWR 13023]|uniref:Prolyl oligopeptidase family serine peptidase n=2 Tax=Nitrobacteraceae TaxID=41294 RepID=A0A9X1UAB7_9BRAD|nr:PHB depolymerase family esterase [Bradyrhizobium zhengyangense]MCG2629701.1 prolyl oligopeptidase family serine peptidase [Bradyrhizobium zhengyangense]MCG2642299.1 prolyl oligopeptidase family serine peptidase [Bradyrhizobium zhengyangense]MCG2667788.1 prolyl oligopeptidase family serine peptidase [Bradyrhizobium zhengyangense]